MSTILFSIEEGVGKISLNRPEVYNSFNREMSLAFQKTLYECRRNDQVRAIFITGEGKAFSAGQDLQEVTDKNGPSISKIVGEHYNPIIMEIRTIEKPFVGAVNGVAAGAGANIALACDITVAAESASFIQAFSKIGLIPDSGGTFYLPRLIGMQRANALTMLGEKISGKEAESIGMIYKAFADGEFVGSSWEIATRLATMPTRGIGLTKHLFNRSLTNDLKTQLALEDQMQSRAAATDDYHEGVAAFLEKRKPKFKGR